MKHQLCLSILLIMAITVQPSSAQTIKNAITNEAVVKIQTNVTDDEVTIEWDTEREKNIHCFVLERSLDGVNYEMMAMVPAKNRYAVGAHYKVCDRETLLQPGMILYYRLKTIDMNGMHGITTLILEKDGAGLISSR
ncbi:MAG: hypothetical protein K1X61_09135 [Chitinophagales bacterium]|nr:hypothetical protein [Chitinophagales bacterium]